MPIYAYECSECEHSRDVLQKLSDKHLVVCPECGKKSFTRKLTAAGFVLKGSGWYVTDFRDGQKKEDNSKDKKLEDNLKNKDMKNINPQPSAKPKTDGSPTNASSASSETKKKVRSKPQTKSV